MGEGARRSSSRRPRSEATKPAVLPEEDSSGAIPDLLRRAVAAGFSSFFTTEEAIRKAFGDTVPRDWVDFASEQSERTRGEFMSRTAEELGRVIEKMDMVEVLEKLLEGRTIEVKAEIRLGDKAKPSTRDGGESGLEFKVAAKDKDSQ